MSKKKWQECADCGKIMIGTMTGNAKRCYDCFIKRLNGTPTQRGKTK